MDDVEQLRAEVKELRLCVRALAEAVLWAVAVQPVRVTERANTIAYRVRNTLERRDGAAPASTGAQEA